MASKEFLETMVSQKQKQLHLKFELLEYDPMRFDFVVINDAIVRERKMPNGMSNVSGSIDINVEQEVKTTFSLEITNEEGINNWSGFSDYNEFNWWLDKRLNIFVGLEIDDTGEIEYAQMGHFVLTHFKSSHNLQGYPITELQGGSKEVLFATRRGKFLYSTTIYKNTALVDAIKTILEGGGEKDFNIKVDPQINDDVVTLDDGESVSEWKVLQDDLYIEADREERMVGESSLRLDVMPNTVGILIEKEFLFPLNFEAINAIGLWARANRNIPHSSMWLVLIDDRGRTRNLPIPELVGHVIDSGGIIDVDNWRNCLLPIEGLDEMTNVKTIQLRLDKKVDRPFSIWIDNIVCAENRNMSPYDLEYGAGDSRWSAIEEISDLLDCNAYYNDYGEFILEKRRFPKERHSADFNYDVYEVLEPKITYRDTDRSNNLYAGADDLFEEHELANHVQVVGGSTNHTVVSMVDMALYEDGLHIKEKGKVINSRGKIRAVDTFNTKTPHVILNGYTDVSEVWKRHKNEDAVVKEYPYGFPHLTEPPISNFAIDRIGDFIYHHNNASPDPVIAYAYEGKNRALWELRRRMAYAEQMDVISVPYYVLRGNDIIRIEDSLLDISDNFQVKSINIPLNGDYMSISAVKIKNLMLDIPYFDLSYNPANACWYGYDCVDLAFTYPLSWRNEYHDGYNNKDDEEEEGE